MRKKGNSNTARNSVVESVSFLSHIDSVSEQGVSGWLVSKVGELVPPSAFRLNGVEVDEIKFIPACRPDVADAFEIPLFNVGTFHMSWPATFSRNLMSPVHIEAIIEEQNVLISDTPYAVLIARQVEAFWKRNEIDPGVLLARAISVHNTKGISTRHSYHVSERSGRLGKTMYEELKSSEVRDDLKLSYFQWHVYMRHCREHPSYRSERNLRLATRQDLANFLVWSLRNFNPTSGVDQLPIGIADLEAMNSPAPDTGLLPPHARAHGLHHIPLTRAQVDFVRQRYGRVATDSPEEFADWLLSWVGSWGLHHRGWILLSQSQQVFLDEETYSASDTVPPVTRFMEARWREYGSLAELEQLDSSEAFLSKIVHLVLDELCSAASTILVYPAVKWLSDSNFLNLVATHDPSGFFAQFDRLMKAIASSPVPDVEAFEADIAVLGMLESKSGLGSNARNSLVALKSSGFDPKSFSVALHDRSVAAQQRVARPPKSRINLIHMNPDNIPELVAHLGPKTLDASYNIGFFAWELDLHPRAHQLAFDLVDEIWTPSEYCAESFRRYTNIPVYVMPHAVDLPDLSTSISREDFSLSEDDFVVHISFDLHSWPNRKNPLAAIRVFQDAFRGEPKAKLLIKIRNGKNIGKVDSDREGIGLAIFELASDDPRILIDLEERQYAETLSMIAFSDCYMSLHRSEGFGYGPAEAILVETPLIVSNHSGPAEFCPPDGVWFVPTAPGFVNEGEYYLAPPGARWGKPDIEAATLALQAIRNNPSIAKFMAARAKDSAHPNLSIDLMSRRYSERLSEIRERLATE